MFPSPRAKFLGCWGEVGYRKQMEEGPEPDKTGCFYKSLSIFDVQLSCSEGIDGRESLIQMDAVNFCIFFSVFKFVFSTIADRGRMREESPASRGALEPLCRI